jgi:hypothetical protein
LIEELKVLIPARWIMQYERKEVLGDGDSHSFCTAVTELGRAEEALRMLYEETKDYILVNQLGDPHDKQSMKVARAVLSRNA